MTLGEEGKEAVELTSKEEQPNPPSRLPESDSGTLSDGTSVESVVDEMLQRRSGEKELESARGRTRRGVEREGSRTNLEILAHSNLLHQLVLVSVH